MELVKSIYTLTDEEVKDNVFAQIEGKKSFYNFLREKLDIPKDKKIDCTKIEVAKNIVDSWYKSAEENGIALGDMNMILLMYAPKENSNLGDNEILLLNGFIVEE